MKSTPSQLFSLDTSRACGRIFIITLVISMVALVLVGRAWAGLPGSQIDQSILTPQGQGENYGIAVSANQSLAQTFVVGLSGMLTEVDLQMGRRQPAVAPLQFELRRTASGVPDLSAQALLFSTTLDTNLFPIGMPYDFAVAVDLGNGIPVSAGERLAVVCSTTGDWYYWSSWKLADIYPSGSTCWRPTSRSYFVTLTGQDSGLQTWVLVPEPLGLLPLGLAALAFCGRKRS